MHGRVIPVVAAVLVALGFLGLDFSGYADVTLTTWWWDAFQLFSVLFVLFLLLNWLMRIDRRQPMRKFVA